MRDRLIGGGILVVLMLGLTLYFQQLGIFFLFLIALIIGLYEFYNILIPKASPVTRIWGITCASLIYASAFLGDESSILGLIFLTVMGTFAWKIVSKEDHVESFKQFSILTTSYVYLALGLSFFPLAAAQENGVYWVLLIYVATWAADSSAYLIGRTWGKTKIAPNLSPGKSLEGTVGSVLGCILAVLLVKFTLLSEIRMVDGLILGFLLAVVGAVGDLMESLIKRAGSVKNSGNIILGHGGVLDRLDSLVVNAPAVYFYLVLVILPRGT